MKPIQVIVTACLILSVAKGYSQIVTTDTLPSVSLSEFVVSVSRTESKISELPQSVSMLTSDKITISPYDNVEDILQSLPGIHNFRHSSFHRNGIVSPLEMRGVGKNRVLMLVDGVPQNNNFNNSIAWIAWGHIPKEAIERIEVVRGASSALFGSEGLGGVINIVTKNPEETRNISLKAQGGSASTFGGNAFFSRQYGNFGLLATGSYQKSDGFYMQDKPEDYNTLRHSEKGRLFGKMTYHFNEKSRLGFSALYYDLNAGQGREFFFQEVQLDQYTLDYTGVYNGFKLEAMAFFNRANKTANQDKASDNFSSLYRREHFRDIYDTGLEIQGSVIKWQDATLAMGGSFNKAYLDYFEEYTGSERNGGAEGSQQFFSPFVLLDIRLFNNNLFVNLGLRYDQIQTTNGRNWDTSGSAGMPAYNNEYEKVERESLSPKMGLAWHPNTNTTLRTSVGRGFRAPSLFELYKVHVRQGGTFYREANPALHPEKITSWDLGATHWLTGNAYISATFYRSKATDYIGDRLINSAPFAGGERIRYEYIPDNISEVKIYGVEVESQWNPMPDLSVSGNYTYNISKIEKDGENESLTGNYLPNNPRHNMHLGINYSNPILGNFFLGMNGFAKIFYDQENTLEKDRFATVDMSFSRNFTNHMKLFVNAENILNNQYPIFLHPSREDQIAPGAIIMGGIKYQL